jgi:segregation and condensation protein B
MPEPPLSLGRLRDAFAAMLRPAAESQDASGLRSTPSGLADSRHPIADSNQADSVEINPRSVIEAMLFVGRPDNGAISARELAAAMRGVSPAEVDAAVVELNAMYERDGSPYEITGSSQAYRLALRSEYGRVRDKYFGRIREARLSPAALEVLSVVAYNQPTTPEEINRLRGRSSGACLATLVRRQLVRVERPAEQGSPPRYSTTDRFLRLFGLESLSALPRDEELDAP